MNGTAERIFKLRKYLGLTQAEFSFPLGIKNSLLSKLERGNLELDEAKAKRIAEFYGVSISWIQNGEEPMFQEPADKRADFGQYPKLSGMDFRLSASEPAGIRGAFDVSEEGFGIKTGGICRQDGGQCGSAVQDGE